MTATQTWGHDELAADLAQHLRCDKRMVWCDMQLGPSGSPRPDVYVIERSYSRPMPTAYECKISRSDFRSDTTSGKWQSYLRYAGAVIFAVPEGLITPAEIPEGCGLIVRKAGSWRNMRKPTRRPVALPMDACMKLLLDGVGRTVAPRAQPAPRRFDAWEAEKAVRKKFGDAVARAARDIALAEQMARYETESRERREAEWQQQAKACAQVIVDQAKKDAAEYEAARRDLIEWLGIEGGGTGVFGVTRRISELKAACNVDARVERMERALRQAETACRSATDVLDRSLREGLS
ncbi:MAG: MmcB family DNA repair protein [Pseudomonadota bacterium]|nr:MmcB family DNA repair protein [Pseudomonadota bacterium]